ncbi:Na+/H+ antiporter NhaC family protein [Defluviitalea phaphyphila]|uniref:Na+/H+ antiporter NhaC family protein n=1 Tax=Defluviitalea phaphyphila TaxID=1473580 RepID=UPI0007315335|nr:Na+/H+ antiporter NhaC family protein [Defluviitalea phaphyphila]
MFNKEITVKKQMMATLIFIVVILVGLFVPVLVGKPEYKQSVESVMFFAAIIMTLYILAFTNKKWDDILKAGIKSIQDVVPGFLILLVIGPLIAGFIMSGLIPMLIYYGIKLIHPRLIYLMALILPVIFSIFTGMSWGSGATIGIVMMGVGTALGANPAIVAGAVVSGAYFGDKLSPISAATNIAAMACKVDLYDHVGSMVWTTGPATLISIVIYTICGFIFPATNTNLNTPEVVALLQDLSGIFNFNVFLLIPLVIVLFGSLWKKPAIPVLIVATIISFLNAIIFQNFSFAQVLTGFNSGFKLNMVNWYSYSQPVDGEVYILGYFERGGFWNFGSLLAILVIILFAVGILKSINAMTVTAATIFKKCKSRASIIIASIITGFVLIATTANGGACSFLLAEIWGKKYDEYNIDRRVLSRTSEDTGTLLEVLMPWTPAGIFFATTLGVSTADYAIWAVMNWITPFVAITLAITGIGTYKHLSAKKIENAEV